MIDCATMDVLRKVLILLIIGLGQCSSTEVNLFMDKSIIRSLSDLNLHQNIYHQNRNTLVFFYLNWCGHCIEMSTVLKEFANEIRNWRDVVQVVAIDCATYQICGDMNVHHFPQMLMFPPRSKSVEDAKLVPRENRTPAQLYKVVRDFIVENPYTAVHHFITPIFVTKREEICNTLSVSDQNDVKQKWFVVVEETPSSTSAEVNYYLIFIKFSHSFFFK